MQTVLNGRTTLGDYGDPIWGVPTRSWAATKDYGPVLAVPMVSRSVTVGTLSATRLAGRGFPTHFLTMWMTGLPSHHAGRIGGLHLP